MDLLSAVVCLLHLLSVLAITESADSSSAHVADFYFGHRSKGAPHIGHKRRPQNVAYLKQYDIVEAQDGGNQGYQYNFEGYNYKGSQGTSENVKSKEEQSKTNEGENTEEIQAQVTPSVNVKQEESAKPNEEVKENVEQTDVSEGGKDSETGEKSPSQEDKEENGEDSQRKNDKFVFSSDGFKNFYHKSHATPVSKSLFLLNPAGQSGEEPEYQDKDTFQETKPFKDRQEFFKNAFSLHLIVPIKH